MHNDAPATPAQAHAANAHASHAHAYKKTLPWLKPWVERIAHSFQSPDTQEWIQMYVLEPIISYVIERCFPYFIIFTAIFGLIFLLLIVAIILMVIRLGSAPQLLS